MIPLSWRATDFIAELMLDLGLGKGHEADKRDRTKGRETRPDTRPSVADGWAVACTEMTKIKKIEILRAVHVVELSWATIVTFSGFKSLHLGCLALNFT